MSSSSATCGAKVPAMKVMDGETPTKSSTREAVWEQLSGFWAWAQLIPKKAAAWPAV
jgi:hypothetical protein